MPNLNYPKITKFSRSNKNFSFFLEKYNSSKPHGAYRNFLDQLLKKINVKKSIVQVDHNIQSIHRNAKLKDVLQCLDVIMTHSTT